MNYMEYKHKPKQMITKLCDEREDTANIVIGVILAHLPLEKIIDAKEYVNSGKPIKWEVKTP